MRRRDDLRVAAEEMKEGRVGAHGMRAMEQHHRRAGAAPHDLEVDAANVQALDGRAHQ
jgi:hypothetical protein